MGFNNISIQYNKISFSDDYLNLKLFAVQHDTGRVFYFQVIDDTGQPFDATGCSLEFYISIDENVGFTTGQAVNLSHGKFKVTVPNSLLIKHGKALVQLQLKKGTDKIGTLLGSMKIEASIESGATVGNDVWVDFAEIQQDLQTIKTSEAYQNILEFKQLMATFDTKNAEGKRVTNALKTEINKGNLLVGNITDEVLALQNAKGEVVETINLANTTRSNLTSAANSANTLKNSLSTENTKATTNLSNLNSSIASATTKKTELDTSISSATTKKTELDSSISSANTAISQATKTISDLGTAKTNAQTVVDKATTASSGIDTKIASLNTIKDEANTTVTNAQGLAAQIDESARLGNAVKTNLDTSIANAKLENTDITNKTSALSQAKTDADLVVTKATNAVSDVDSKITALNQIKTESETAVQNAQTASTSIAESVQNANTVKTQIDANINSLTTLTSNAETAKTNLDGSIQSANTTKTGLDDSINSGNLLKTGLDSSINSGNTTKTSLDESITSATSKNTALTQASTKAETLKTALENLTPLSFSADMVEETATKKFVTGAEKTAWNNKVDSVTGKGLSSNDYTTTEKNKLSGIESGANKTEIVNDLTTGGINKALSAEQGKILFQYANDGKTTIANALLAKGQTATNEMTFAELSTQIGNIKTGYEVGDILEDVEVIKPEFEDIAVSVGNIMAIKKNYALFSTGKTLKVYNVETGEMVAETTADYTLIGSACISDNLTIIVVGGYTTSASNRIAVVYYLNTLAEIKRVAVDDVMLTSLEMLDANTLYTSLNEFIIGTIDLTTEAVTNWRKKTPIETGEYKSRIQVANDVAYVLTNSNTLFIADFVAEGTTLIESDATKGVIADFAVFDDNLYILRHLNSKLYIEVLNTLDLTEIQRVDINVNGADSSKLVVEDTQKHLLVYSSNVYLFEIAEKTGGGFDFILKNKKGYTAGMFFIGESKTFYNNTFYCSIVSMTEQSTIKTTISKLNTKNKYKILA